MHMFGFVPAFLLSFHTHTHTPHTHTHTPHTHTHTHTETDTTHIQVTYDILRKPKLLTRYDNNNKMS